MFWLSRWMYSGVPGWGPLAATATAGRHATAHAATRAKTSRHRGSAAPALISTVANRLKVCLRDTPDLVPATLTASVAEDSGSRRAQRLRSGRLGNRDPDPAAVGPGAPRRAAAHRPARRLQAGAAQM